MKQIGQEYGLLTVIKLNWTDQRRNKHYLCRCKCGQIVDVREDNMTLGDIPLRGKTYSCGCHRRENILNKTDKDNADKDQQIDRAKTNESWDDNTSL